MDENAEKLKNKSVLKQKGKNGGPRPGAGRKKGGKNKKTLEQQAALERFRERTRGRVDEFFNSQSSLAQGLQYLIRIDKILNAKGKVIREEHVRVTDPDEMIEALDNRLEKGDKYYYLTAIDPDNRAIDSLLDRTFGKATETVELKNKKPLTKVVLILKDSNGKRKTIGVGSDERVHEDSGSTDAS